MQAGTRRSRLRFCLPGNNTWLFDEIHILRAYDGITSFVPQAVDRVTLKTDQDVFIGAGCNLAVRLWISDIGLAAQNTDMPQPGSFIVEKFPWRFFFNCWASISEVGN